MNIDEFIVAETSSSWRKTAMIIARAMTSSELPASDKLEADVIADRIMALVAKGILEVAGDISDWRHSEIRRAQ